MIYIVVGGMILIGGVALGLKLIIKGCKLVFGKDD